LKVITRIGAVSAALAGLLVAAAPSHAREDAKVHPDAVTVQKLAAARVAGVSDAALVRSLPGFRNGFAEVNGVRLHYVVGGKGEP
jgi:hypothetical protein